mgnify:CR=1 FL=1
MELKHIKAKAEYVNEVCFNRTFMELKLSKRGTSTFIIAF